MQKTLLVLLMTLTSVCAFGGAIFEVEDYGYTGSNPVKDLEAFEMALLDARTAGGKVVLRCGTYVLEDTLWLETGDVLIGQGSDETTIEFTVGLLEHLTNAPNQQGVGIDQDIHLEGFTVKPLFRENVFYRGVSLWGVDRPVVRDIRVRDVSLGHAILFRNCRDTDPGDIHGLYAQDCDFSIDPDYVPGSPSPSRSVIHFSGCENMQASNISVQNSRSTAPGKDRDAISCVGSENMHLSGLRGDTLNTLLDAGFNKNSVFEDFFGQNLDFVAVYANNGNQGCVFRNGKFVDTDYGIVVISAGTGINDVEAYNLFKNFEFWNIGNNGATPRPGIWVSHNSPGDPSRGPHDNRFHDINFVDTNPTPGISRVVLEEHGAVGKNHYRNCTLETTATTTPVSDRVTGAVLGPNLQGFEERVGYLEVNFSAFSDPTWQSPTFTIPGVTRILGVTTGLSTSSPSDAVQHINVSARAVSGNTFRLVVATTDGTSLSAKALGPLRLTFRALCE